MNSGKIVAGRVDGWTSKVLQEVLADLKIPEKSRLEVQKGELKIDIGASFSVPTKRLKWDGLVCFGGTKNGN